jgi:hypothetical protein
MSFPLRPATRSLARAAAFVAALLVTVSLVGVVTAGSASATSYRFWSYWTGGDSWTFSSQGASRHPADGSVDGWRFAISPASSSTIPPRHSPSFDRLCRGVTADDGQKRVGLVVDFGTTEDAPSGDSPQAMIATCAVVPDDANGYEVLLTVAQLRTDGGMICGINGYPATECGVPVADPTTSPTQQPSGDGDKSPTTNGTSDGKHHDAASGTDPTNGSTGTPDADASPTSKTETPDTKDGKKRTHSASATESAVPADPGDRTAAAAAATTAPGSPSSGSPLGVIIGLVVIVGVGTAAVVVARRRT